MNARLLLLIATLPAAAALDTNEKRELTSSAWELRESADRARRDAERAAFKKLVQDFEKNWPRIVERAKQGA